MDSDLNKKIVRDYITDVINTGNTANITDYISNDYCEVYNGKVYEVGIQGAVNHVMGVRQTYADLKLNIEKQWCEGTYVITSYVMSGIHVGTWMGIKPTHKPVEIHGINVNRVVDGKIIEHGGAANMLEPLLSIDAISLNKD